MARSILIVLRRGPYGTLEAAEAIRHLNGAVANGFAATGLLVDDGVYLLLPDQQAASNGYTSCYEALRQMLAAPADRRVRLLVHAPSMQERGLEDALLPEGTVSVDDHGMAQATLEAGSLMVF